MLAFRAGIFGAVILWTAGAFAQWQWSPDAPHHNAIVRVSIAGQQGSGALICTDPGIVATAKHVVSHGNSTPSQTATVVWSNGYVATGELYGAGNQTDLAFYRVSVPQDAAFVPLADEMPSAGQTVEICGYGGPTKALRHFSGPVLASDADSIKIDAYVISGDSGGAILCDGRLVAINWGGNTTTAYTAEDGANWPLVYPATGWGLGPLRRILTQCQEYCPPPQQPRIQGGVIGFGRIRYIDPPPQQPQRGSTAPPKQPAPPAIQPPSDGGSLTPSQPPSQPSQDFEAIRASLEAGMLKINARVDAISIKLDGIQGCECEERPDQTPATKSRVFVVTGDPKADYYGRLKTDVEKTATTFDTVILRSPPSGLNVGTLPAISYFVDGVHVITHRGVIPVQSQLHKIRNGDYQ